MNFLALCDRSSLQLVQSSQCRRMATLKAISMRLRSVSNIQKITKSMKMVSAAKYARAERELKPAVAFGQGAQAFYRSTELLESSLADEQKQAAAGSDNNQIVVAITSDRGLCGAVHSNVAKSIRSTYKATSGDSSFKLVCIGDKSRSIMQRTHRDSMLMHVSEVGKRGATFTDAAYIVLQMLQTGFAYDTGRLYYNRFRSVVSYETTYLPVFSPHVVLARPQISLYDSLDDWVMESYLHFSLASILFYAMKEGACSEQSSRMTAMDNASTNASDMIASLTLKYNRTRQAVITRELIEIISGAAAV